MKRRIKTANEEPLDIEVFAGGGGMAVGLRQAGFSPVRFYEADEACCDTLEHNSAGRGGTIRGHVVRGRTEEVDWSGLKGRVRLLAAGAPCQPFSFGGNHNAQRDERNLFPEVLRAVRETKPAAVLIENVSGMLRDSFNAYFSYVLRQLQFPSVKMRPGETWRSHNGRLKHLAGADASEYNVKHCLVNAADFGVPQNRMRVFIVATSAGIPAFEFPDATHSRAALINALHSNEYWDRHGVRRPRHFGKIQAASDGEASLLPWRTVRDAICGLPDAAPDEDVADINHWEIPGARSYPGHTGSKLDWISKTIKAGVHGVPGGENTVVDDTGRVRYFTLRETARIQCFPDNHLFIGTRSVVTKQIGNAVPCELAGVMARPLFRLLKVNGEMARNAQYG